MTGLPPVPSEPVRAALERGFRELRPRMIADAHADADLDPNSRIDAFSDSDLEQFLKAYETMFLEALDGSSATRDFVFETALPGVLELGQTALDMIRSNVISSVMLAHRLLPLVDPELRDDAARWLAAYQSGYAYELAQRVIALEAAR